MKHKKKRFNFFKSVKDLEKELPRLPGEDVVYKLVSDGGFSSISFVKYIADRAKIQNFYASSFRIGRKELQIIEMLHRLERIDMCHFAVGTLMSNDSVAVKKYKYYDNFKLVCETNGWEYITVNNHSKLLLFDTEAGKYVVETSSNLNENPKIEQFSFEKSDELFDFYRSEFRRWSDG